MGFDKFHTGLLVSLFEKSKSQSESSTVVADTFPCIGSLLKLIFKIAANYCSHVICEFLIIFCAVVVSDCLGPSIHIPQCCQIMKIHTHIGGACITYISPI